MGKKRAQKDRMYVSATEHQQSAAGYHRTDGNGNAGGGNHNALPFDRCALTLKPWAADAVCTTKEGWCCFDLLALTPYLQQHKQHPVFHTPLHARDLIPLHFHTNADGQYIDPVTYQPLTHNSHVIALRPTGHIYLYSSINEMCIKQKSMLDLIDGSKFSASDIITIQNPSASMPTFQHTGHDRQAGTTHTKAADDGVKRVKPSAATATTGVSNQAGSFSSTATAVEHDAQREPTASQADDAIRQQIYKQLRNESMRGTKAYARLHTTFGNLDLRIHCDLVPAASHNWLQLAADGRYDGTEFHRVIADFMAQGGKSKNGVDRAAFGPTLADEFHPVLKHDARGVVAYANSGKNTSTQQFYITFKECPHLDNKHSVFADLIGDMPALDKLEHVAVDDADRPLQQILITGVTVFDEPFTKLSAQAKADANNNKKQADREPAHQQTADRNTWFSNPTKQPSGSDADSITSAPQEQPKTALSLPAARTPAPKAAAPATGAAAKLYAYDQW